MADKKPENSKSKNPKETKIRYDRFLNNQGDSMDFPSDKEPDSKKLPEQA